MKKPSSTVSMTVISKNFDCDKFANIREELLPYVTEAIHNFRKKHYHYPNKIYMSDLLHYKLIMEINMTNFAVCPAGKNELMGMKLIISKTKGMRISGPSVLKTPFGGGPFY